MSNWKKVGRIVAIVGLVVVGAIGFVWWRLYHPPIPPGPAIELPAILKAEDLKEDNACYWYLKAAEALVNGDKVRHYLDELWKSGKRWDADDDGLNRLLEDNAKAFSFFDNGVAQDTSQMPTLLRTQVPLPRCYEDFRWLAWLQILRGRKAEWEGRAADAIRHHSDVIRFGSDIGHGSPIIGILVAYAIGGIGQSPLLRDLVAHHFQDAMH